MSSPFQTDNPPQEWLQYVQSRNILWELSKGYFYHFYLLPNANWERLQIETARNLILDIEQQADESHSRALIFDDSLYQRFRGKGTQLPEQMNQ